MSERTTLMIKKGGVIPLTKKIIKSLNLLEGDKLDVIFAEEGYLILEKSTSKQFEVSLSGDLKYTNIADIFSIISMSSRTGKLTLLRDEITRNIFFKKGEIIYASSNDPEFLLGKILYKLGFLTKEKLEEAEKLIKESKERIGAILVKNNFLTPRELWAGVKYQLEEIVYSAFELQDGYFIFVENMEPPQDVVRFSLNTQNILMEGFRRLDERAVIKQAIPSLDVRLFIVPDKTPSGLSESLKKVYACVEDGCTVKEVIRKTQMGEFKALKLIHNLISMNFIRVEGVEAKVEAGGEEALRSLILGYNTIFAKTISILKEHGLQMDFKNQIKDFINTMSPKLKDIFSQAEVDESGFFDPAQIIENAQSSLMVDSERFLKVPELDRLLMRQRIVEGFGEILNFLHFTARNYLNEKDYEQFLSETEKIKKEALASR